MLSPVYVPPLLQDARKLVTEYAKDPVVAKKLITLLAKVDSPAKMAAFADKIGEFVKEAERKQAITSYKTTYNIPKRIFCYLNFF